MSTAEPTNRAVKDRVPSSRSNGTLFEKLRHKMSIQIVFTIKETKNVLMNAVFFFLSEPQGEVIKI